MNPYANMNAEQIRAHVTENRTNEADVQHALSRLADIARADECLILSALLTVLADEPEEIAASHLPMLRGLVSEERPAIIPAAIAVLESVDNVFSLPPVLQGCAT